MAHLKVAGKLMFIGECRSITAQRKGWTWADGRLAAKTLFQALSAMGVNPAAHEYANLWSDNAAGTTYGSLRPGIRGSTIQRVKDRMFGGAVIVALGKRVSHELARRGIVHVALVHPAARGAIRKREHYHAHVADKLGSVLPRNARKESGRGQTTHAPGLLCGLPSPGSRAQNYQGGEYLRPMQESSALIARPGELFDCKRCKRIVARDARATAAAREVKP